MSLTALPPTLARMLNELAPLAATYARNTTFLDTLVRGFTPADWRDRRAGNHALWLIGHIAWTRNAARRLLGETTLLSPWEKLFGFGSSPDDGDACDPADLLAAIRSGEAPLLAGLALRTDSDLAAALSFSHPMGKTLGEFLNFLPWHETYHLGQLGTVKKLLGKTSA